MKTRPKQGMKQVQRWVAVNKLVRQEGTNDGDLQEGKEHHNSLKKVVEAVWSEEQKSRLERSLLGVCVKPIEFRKVMNLLLDEWQGPGDIECRDVGPYRRVWIEITGMPVGLWCTENFDRIIKQWGKMIIMDDRTEDSKSYTTARVLIDCFQWEKVHEWVTVTVDDKLAPTRPIANPIY
ncbi:hypothetical protein PIB30_029059 [Stylosanthes scabra]|uniref:DUF4283 domain-containing protein n=1 Tax=Stylosanthes scabra TaxID=79078 RepID=A0ABU6QBC9_9FABA|nr:hypothetical protein [Stylosanthes scabra]